ncbi:MAG: deoxyribodipyrimidine photo-lyase, partial [Kiritimatiellia bacterium]
MTEKSPLIVWFRNDLRLEDHPALHAAASEGAPILPVYLHCPDAEGNWPRGAASNWWLHHALKDLARALEKKGSRLILRSGKDPGELLRKLKAESGAEKIYWNRRYEPAAIQTDTRLKKEFSAESFRGDMLWEPHSVKTNAGDPYKVFTPYYKA